MQVVGGGYDPENHSKIIIACEKRFGILIVYGCKKFEMINDQKKKIN